MPAKKTAASTTRARSAAKPKASAPRQPAAKKPKAAPRVKKPAGQNRKLPKNLLQAGLSGLSALSLPRAESAVADGFSKMADSFGFKKLEDVFDQRVASALERMGNPSAAEFSRLVARIEALEAQLKSLTAKSRK